MNDLTMWTRNATLPRSSPQRPALLWLPEGQDFIFQQFNTGCCLFLGSQGRSQACAVDRNWVMHGGPSLELPRVNFCLVVLLPTMTCL